MNIDMTDLLDYSALINVSFEVVNKKKSWS